MGQNNRVPDGLAQVALAQNDLAAAQQHAAELLDYLATHDLDGIVRR